MSIKLACADFTWPLLSHDQSLALIATLGFEGVDLGIFGNRSHVRPEMIRQDVPMWAGILRERLEQHGLEPADVFLIPSTAFDGMTPNHPDPKEREAGREAFSDVLDLARRLEAKGISSMCGVVFEGESESESIRNAAEELSWRVDQADRYGITVSVEPAVGTNADTPEKALEMLTLSPGLKLTLDYCHFVYQGMDQTVADILLPHARHFHCRGCAPGRMQVDFDENEIDYRRIINKMHEVGYSGWFGVEFVWTAIWNCNQVDNTAETIRFRDLALAVINGTEHVPFAHTI
jgi:sugar phosphate isomerase/epimerase